MASLLSRLVFGSGVCAVVLLVTGCADHNHRVAQTLPPPPPVWASGAQVQQATGNGFRDGRSDGERDVLSGYRYNAQADQKFRVVPGYDERSGPFDVYRDTYRDAYLRGYDNGFRHAKRDR